MKSPGMYRRYAKGMSILNIVDPNKKQKRYLTTLVSQRRKTLTIEELSDSEMLLNRESNPGLPRLVNCEVTTEVVVSGWFVNSEIGIRFLRGNHSH